MNLSRDVVQAARATLEGTPCPLDVGDFGGLRNFSYVASFGLFTAASYSAPQATKEMCWVTWPTFWKASRTL